MVPPWVPPAPPSNPAPSAPDENASAGPAESGAPKEANPGAPSAPRAVIPIAPAGRFSAARRSAGDFARTGSARDMRRSVGHYVHKGYGGSSTAVKRFGGTVSTAGALYSALSPGESGTTGEAGQRLDRTLLAGRSATEVIDAVIEAVRPVDGTQDAEASRSAIKDALSELLTRFPEADLLQLTLEQREFAIERYVSVDVFQRFALDLAKTIQDKAPSPTAALGRLKDVKEYVKETISAAFRKLKAAGTSLTSGRVTQIVKSALSEAMQVFEHYVT